MSNTTSTTLIAQLGVIIILGDHNLRNLSDFSMQAMAEHAEVFQAAAVRLDIIDQSADASCCVELRENSGSTFFEPQREVDGDTPKKTCNAEAGACLAALRGSHGQEAPGKELTLFALRLAILEKAASGLGALGFIWATVVLLGGFAVALEKEDFWFITTILLVEGARIFSRSRELEWQHQATWSGAEERRSSFEAIRSCSQLVFTSLKFIARPFSMQSTRIADDVQMLGETLPADARGNSPERTWRTSEVPIITCAGWVFLSRNVSGALCWLQLLAALACVTLSLMRLVQQDFGELPQGDPDEQNRGAALNIFYGLALAEALLFLVEKAYWEWKVSYRMLLHEVNKECQLGASGIVSIRRFFYDTYSMCIKGSIFDGLRMDLVTFAEELLASGSREEQLIGARILLKFSSSHRFADGTLRKLGTSASAIERLIEMLNWTGPEEEELRRSAAVIVSKLAGKKQNALRVAGIPGAVDSISSLLYAGCRDAMPDHGCNREVSVFNLLGLLILKKLANDQDNCGKIGNTRGLLAKIIDFTRGGARLTGARGAATASHIKAMKRSLHLVKKLASTTGQTGKVLRKEISEIVFTVSNIREILQHAENHAVLQKLGIQILTSLSMDDEARERIGGTGGMIKVLLRIFFSFAAHNAVRAEAGEALAMLALGSENNCCSMLQEARVVERLVGALRDPVLRISSSKILRNLCKYAGGGHALQLTGVTEGFSTVLNTIVVVEEKQLLEVSLGLAAQTFRFMCTGDCTRQLGKAGITEEEFAGRLVQILNEHDHPCIKVPRMRRFVVELVIWMIECDAKYVTVFDGIGMKQQLEGVSETTSELERFHVFSGSVGLSRRSTPLCAMVDVAMKLMTKI